MKVRSYITSLVALSTFSGLLLSWSIQRRYADIEAKSMQSGINSLIGTQTNQARQQIDQYLVTCELVIKSNVLYLGANVGQQREILKESLVGLSKHSLSPVQQDSLQRIDRKIGRIHSLVQRKMAVSSARTSSSSVSKAIRGEFAQETSDLKTVFDSFNHEVSELIFRTEQDIAELRADLPRTILLLGVGYIFGLLMFWFWTVNSLIQPIESLTTDVENAMKTGEAFEHEDTGPKEIYRMSTVIHKFITSLSEQVEDRTKQLSQALSDLQSAQSSVLEEKEQAEANVLRRTEELNEALERETKLVDVLDNANKKLSRSMKLKDQFLANMSHELRTPLNAGLGLCEAVAEEIYGPVNAAQAKALGTIDESGRHLLNLINEILDLSKIEAGKIEPILEVTQVDNVCRAVIESVTAQAQKKNLNVSYTNTSKTPTVVLDPQRLRQALYNLIGNAAKFTPSGRSIGLEVCDSREGMCVSFTVWDEGPGISEEEREILFEPFVQLDGGLSRKNEGTGLGLAIVHRMSKALGWELSLETEEGMGSRFTIEVPKREQWKDADETVELTYADVASVIKKGSSDHSTIVIDEEPANDG
ncbi:MAG: ATP-binding protein [Myxococcota bacterium]|nr:ATP-binding protein [Myxococcota bacterium]